MTPARFAILHHITRGGEHWDLMLERTGVLLTWQLQRDPTSETPWPIAARRIGDHRLAYLDYEGPVSGDRGRVIRVDGGPLTIVAEQPDRLTFELKGSQWAGRFLLRRTGENDWALDRDPKTHD